MKNETATRIELDVVDTVCGYLEISVGEVFERKVKSEG
ncbi:helix-turn-helix domain-containing protein [Vibrio aestuarianus]